MKPIFFFFTFLIVSNVFAQQRLLKGVVKDTLGQPLEFANVMAEPDNPDLSFVFGLTDKQGVFELKILEGENYTVTVSFMGFENFVFKIPPTKQDMEKAIVLKPATQLLDEVVIQSTTPMKITKDSIIYDVKHFVSGKEFKLKSVLKKLPGIVVDRNGQISVMGKKVTQVFVEDKPFFGGNSELAVENLPANVVKKIEIINDYNQVSFMKGLNDEQKMILNIKLKAGKKKFVFGDVQAGTNTDKNYLGKANLFYYSPNTNLSYIGNFNDIGLKSLSLLDVSRFENKGNSFSKAGISNNTTSPLRSLLINDDFIQRKIRFNGLQWQQDIGSKWELSMFGVTTYRESKYKNTNFNTYLADTPFDEVIANEQSADEGLHFGKLRLTFKPSARQFLDLITLVNSNTLNQKKLTSTSSLNKTNAIDIGFENEKISIVQDLNWYKKFNKKNIVKLNANFSYKNRNPKNKWLADEAILEAILPLVKDDKYNVNQYLSSKTTQFNFLFKYFYKINAKNHLYFSIGNNYSSNLFKNNVFQIIGEQRHDFNDFINDYSFKTNDLYLGMQYRFKLFGGLFTPGIYAHYLSWLNSYQNRYENKWLLLPRLDVEFETVGKIKFNYQLTAELPASYKFSYNFMINSFNTAYRGNTLLSNELFHDMNLNYSYATFGSRIYFNFNLNYQRKLNSVKNKYYIDKTDTYISPVNVLQPEDLLNGGFSFSKEWQTFYIRFTPIYSYNRFYEFVDDVLVLNRSHFINNKFSIGSHYKDYPEIELGLEKNYYSNELDNSSRSFKVNELNPFAYFEYQIKGFTSTLDYKLKFINGDNSIDKPYHFLDASVRYGKEEGRFGFEVSCTNLLNTDFIENYYQSTYLYAHSIIYNQPRIWMVKIHYKL